MVQITFLLCFVLALFSTVTMAQNTTAGATTSVNCYNTVAVLGSRTDNQLSTSLGICATTKGRCNEIAVAAGFCTFAEFTAGTIITIKTSLLVGSCDSLTTTLRLTFSPLGTGSDYIGTTCCTTALCNTDALQIGSGKKTAVSMGLIAVGAAAIML